MQSFTALNQVYVIDYKDMARQDSLENEARKDDKDE